MSRRVVGPFNRVEGDLEVQLETAGGVVSDAWVVSPLYRGFENMLAGRDPMDALVYVPRICGICSVSQSVAAAAALEALTDGEPPSNGRLAINLIHATENVADHLTHFYLFFMPDFAREAYAGRPWFPAIRERFKAVEGRAAREVLVARGGLMRLMGLLAGKWPHTLGIRPGGTTRAVTGPEVVRILGLLHGFRRFLEDTLFGDTLEAVAALDSAAAMEEWRNGPAGRGDMGRFLDVAAALGLEDLGTAPAALLSYGAYHGEAGPLFRPGVWRGGPAPLDLDAIIEDGSHSWLAGGPTPAHPYDGTTVPDADARDGYTWCKAPRLGGGVMEVGALARQAVDGHPLILELLAGGRSSVRARVVARLLEVARTIPAMEAWARALRPREPFCGHGRLPDDGRGHGVTEAARGSLGHWLRVEGGRIVNYQIIAPTTWNFSPRDTGGTRGVLEEALLGTPVDDGRDSVAVQHVVRSFDPCMVCTVH